MSYTLTESGGGIEKFVDGVEALSGGAAKRAYVRALNDAGKKTRTASHKALAGQTGLKKTVARRALRFDKANTGELRFTINGTGGEIALKYFGARETRKGVSAAPRGERKVFKGTFIKGGRFPGRKDLGFGGHAFRPSGRGWGRPFDQEDTDIAIPDEMVKGVTGQAFQRVGQRELDYEVARQLALVTGGAFD